MDSVSLLISIAGMVGGVTIIFQLRKQKLEVALGIGGSVILLGLVLLAIAYELISGPAVWVITGSVLVILASSFYVAKKGKWAPRREPKS